MTRAFVDVLGPGVSEVIARAPGPVTVIPTFLSSGYHVRVDVPREVRAAGRSDVTISAPLGPHPLLVAAMADRLRAAGWRRGDAVILAAAGSSDPRAVAAVRAAAGPRSSPNFPTACSRAAAGQLSGKVGSRVRVGFVATGTPRVVPLVSGLRAAERPRVAVAAWLLAPGLFHSTLGSSDADVVAAPLGAHPLVIERLAQLAEREAVLRSA